MELDPLADLTLRVVRAVQGPPIGLVAEWFVVPDLLMVTWSELAQQLAAMPKPVVISPLLQPGVIGIWARGSLTESQQRAVDQHTGNQTRFFTQKLALAPALPASTIEVTPAAGGPMQLTRPEFERWLRDYSINVGLGLVPSDTPRAARLILVPVPGDGRPPLGIE